MVPVSALWLPILLSAVFVFIASAILHMMLPWHKGDCRQLPDEPKVLDALRTAGVTPGRAYRFSFVQKATKRRDSGSGPHHDHRFRGILR